MAKNTPPLWGSGQDAEQHGSPQSSKRPPAPEPKGPGRRGFILAAAAVVVVLLIAAMFNLRAISGRKWQPRGGPDIPDAITTLTAFQPAANADWTPVERDFDGVTMVLVPAGCFMMGSTDEQVDEQVAAGAEKDLANRQLPQHEQCFETPFWIDKYEVTNGQFAEFGGQAGWASRWTGEDLPREIITWFEARDFCAQRGGRLPAEAEWEYAARGPDNLVYPWGNTWNANNAVWNRSSSQGTANVGSIPAGVSWVGALDMSGNVWEWTSSLFEPYPYDAGDGREADTGSRTDVHRVLRGGSWVNSVNFLRAPFRGWFGPGSAVSYGGFRCARDFE